MKSRIGKQFRSGVFSLVCGWALVGSAASALAQGDAPVKPANVTAPPRYYVIESVVVVALFGAAIFGVCRSSGRN